MASTAYEKHFYFFSIVRCEVAQLAVTVTADRPDLRNPVTHGLFPCRQGRAQVAALAGEQTGIELPVGGQSGTMAVKRTHDLIPFCHPLPIDGCRFAVSWADATSLRIECSVRTTHRTGVEMEALTGATVAALTVYDMCKALSHEIVIGPARLLGKSGGKSKVGLA